MSEPRTAAEWAHAITVAADAQAEHPQRQIRREVDALIAQARREVEEKMVREMHAMAWAVFYIVANGIPPTESVAASVKSHLAIRYAALGLSDTLARLSGEVKP